MVFCRQSEKKRQYQELTITEEGMVLLVLKSSFSPEYTVEFVIKS